MKRTPKPSNGNTCPVISWTRNNCINSSNLDTWEMLANNLIYNPLKYLKCSWKSGGWFCFLFDHCLRRKPRRNVVSFTATWWNTWEPSDWLVLIFRFPNFSVVYFISTDHREHLHLVLVNVYFNFAACIYRLMQGNVYFIPQLVTTNSGM